MVFLSTWSLKIVNRYNIILPLESILPFKVCGSLNKLICCGVVDSATATNEIIRSSNLCRKGTLTKAVYTLEGYPVCEYREKCKLEAVFLSNHFFVNFNTL